MRKMFAFLVSVGFVFSALALSEQEMREIAEKALREAAAESARQSADYEKIARGVAEKAAVDAAESAIKSAATKAAAAAAEAAAKEAAEKTAKEYEDLKAAKEEKKESLRQIDTRIFRLVHASADEVAENFNMMWSGEFGVNWKLSKIAVAFPESNSIMVTAPRLILEACEKAIRELDIEAQQVYIEARFVELGNSASHKIGIDWSMLGGMTGTANLGGGIQSYNVGKGVSEYSRTITTKSDGSTTYKVGNNGSSDGSITYFNGTLDFSQMSLTLKALDATEDTKMFSNPKIIVSSGKKAVVDMTTKYPNVQIAAKKTINNNNESVDLDMKMAAIPGEDKFMFAKEAFFSWGISLEVTPRISTNGLINVSIVPTISDCVEYVTAGTEAGSEKSSASYSAKYPIIKVQRLVSEFNLESGTTAVIGGLSITEEKQVDNGIPLLRSIPWIGPRIFGSLERVKEQKEIIVFVTVGLVNPRKVAPDAGLPKNAVLGRQYTKGQKLEPGDRPEKNMEGFSSLDMRPLEEQERDPLKKQKFEGENFFRKFNFFQKESEDNK